MNKKPKIAPEAYAHILQNIELSSIYLIETKSKLEEGNHSKQLDLNVKEKFKFEVIDRKLQVIYGYQLVAKGEDKEKPFIDITVSYKILYAILDDVEITKDFMDVFSELSLSFIVWPYFRELVQGLISRMNLPPLTLPMRKAITE